MGRGFALFAGAAPEIIRASAREAEGLGYSSFWVNHPGATDGLAALALAATETRRIELGIGVIPLHTRGPDSIVQGVRANALPLGRLLLGAGSPNPGALRRMRDGVAALRSELPVRLDVASLGPQMCGLAGEVADAVLFNWLTPEHARRSAEWVRVGGEEAARYATIPAYAAHFARMGVKPVETAIAAAQSPDALAPALGKWQGVVDEIVLRAITGTDTVEENVALLRAAKPLK